MMDTAILYGRVYREGRWEDTNIYLKDGKIAKITKYVLVAKDVIDATGLWVIPGLIDPHVHFHLQVGESISRDDFYTGSVLAAYGGVTTYIDFLDPIKEVHELPPALEKRLNEAKKSLVDYSFHTTIAGLQESIMDLGKRTVIMGLPSIKLFTTYASSGRQTKDDVIGELLRYSKDIGYRVLIHAENNELIDESKGAKVSEHEERRPALSETSEVMKLAALTRSENGLCYIVHTNCGTTIELLDNQYNELLDTKDLTIETCPHYLLMNNKKYDEKTGYRYVMTPPLRSDVEQSRLKKQLKRVNIIATDHCPYREDEKNKSILDQIPNGIEGIPYTLPSLFKEFGDEILPKLTHESAKIHGLYPRKGVISENSDGDIVLFDPKIEWIVSQDEPWFNIFNRNSKESPYEGMEMKGRVKTTFVRGHKVMDNGSIFPNKGEFVKRKIAK